MCQQSGAKIQNMYSLDCGYSNCRIPSNSDLANAEKESFKVLTHFTLMEEAHLKQKSRIQWLKLGDSKTGFFHKVVRARQSKSRLLSLYNAERVTSLQQLSQQVKELALPFSRTWQFKKIILSCCFQEDEVTESREETSVLPTNDPASKDPTTTPPSSDNPVGADENIYVEAVSDREIEQNVEEADNIPEKKDSENVSGQIAEDGNENVILNQNMNVRQGVGLVE